MAAVAFGMTIAIIGHGRASGGRAFQVALRLAPVRFCSRALLAERDGGSRAAGSNELLVPAPIEGELSWLKAAISEGTQYHHPSPRSGSFS
jgi:hypothetical protein